MTDFEQGQNSIIALIRQWATHNAKIGRHGTNTRLRWLAAKLERERPVQVPIEPQGRAIPLVEDGYIGPVQREMIETTIRSHVSAADDEDRRSKNNALLRYLKRKVRVE